MFLMYVDESGDVGMSAQSPTRYFVLTGLILHELRWKDSIEQILEFRRRMKATFGLRINEEIHAAQMLTKPGEMVRIPRNERLTILRYFANEIASIPDLSIINIVVDKQGKLATYDPFEMAWRCLIQRFENTISYRNFPGPANPDEKGMLFPDHTDDKKLVGLLRKMHRWNPTPNAGGDGYRNLQLSKIVEDPNFRESHRSHLVQAADLCAFLLYQNLEPNALMRKKGGQNFFQILEPKLCKFASKKDANGIVRL